MPNSHPFWLGFIQGITEFLPISSSAHLLLAPWFFGWETPGLAFDAFLHLGTVIAVGIYFFGDLYRIFKAGFMSILERRIGFDRDRTLFWLIIVGTIPAGVAGVLWGDWLEANVRSPLLVAMTLSLVGFLLYWIDGRSASIKSIEDVGIKEALWIGIAQATALIPGVSRSGSTITMARLLGFNREASARFSFILGFPVILAAALFKWKDLATAAEHDPNITMSYLLTGLISSAFFGLLSIHLLLQWLRTTSYAVFAWYRILLAGIVIIWSIWFKT